MAVPPNDHPGVRLPPPLIYAAFFLASLLLQKGWPMHTPWLHSALARGLGIACFLFFLACAFPALLRFFRTRNTVVTMKAASSLQTTGIYAFSRNPMYLALFWLYLGLIPFYGHAWTLMLMPLLFIILERYVVRREERYLQRAFGDDYTVYREKVPRWL